MSISVNLANTVLNICLVDNNFYPCHTVFICHLPNSYLLFLTRSCCVLFFSHIGNFPTLEYCPCIKIQYILILGSGYEEYSDRVLFECVELI